jgi:hypothetical protein
MSKKAREGLHELAAKILNRKERKVRQESFLVQ